ncbi:unnamed protein product [Arabis nemorensis]|uniref:Bifunctional inhibitor/plant lipid transfer protein/seed storage helical domain-containing protein n=1 Tax=Arabis nemorensis TaxID=586526 RepID=A0A565CER3_9BRAS|nr:unnamed protein product [Arabis nemorensis]
MASKKMMTTTIALFLTINLVFFGFTAAQVPSPQPPVCPRDRIQLQPCILRLRLSLFLTPRIVEPCCTLVAGLSPAVASVCLCNAVRISILNFIVITARLDQVLRLCNVSPPTGFRCT